MTKICVRSLDRVVKRANVQIENVIPKKTAPSTKPVSMANVEKKAAKKILIA